MSLDLNINCSCFHHFSPQPATWRSLDFKKTSRSSPAWSPASSKQATPSRACQLSQPRDPNSMASLPATKNVPDPKNMAHAQLSLERVEPAPYMRACQLHYAHIECHLKCQIECQIKCQIAYRQIRQIGMPQRKYQIGCQMLCQRKCQSICQVECQIQSQIQCQIQCQNICQIECHIKVRSQILYEWSDRNVRIHFG